jgi:hypothetical protein
MRLNLRVTLQTYDILKMHQVLVKYIYYVKDEIFCSLILSFVENSEGQNIQKVFFLILCDCQLGL